MKILLINPPIYDFAAFNLWARPIALLKVAKIFKDLNIDFSYYDFLDLSKFKNQKGVKLKKNGSYNYPKIPVEKPEIFPKIKRNFYRYGSSKEDFIKFIENKNFDYVIITSIMTYWYLGVKEVTEIVRNIIPDAKIILGGIYVNLCKEHALKTLKPDFLVHSIEDILSIIFPDSQIKHLKFFPLPLELHNENPFSPIYTSFGCPFNCPYCANKFLNPPFFQRSIDEVIDEILYYFNLGIKKFAFYDEALLLNKKNHFIPLMKKIIDLNLDIEFYTPNGLHVNQIDEEIAEIMKCANFKDLRLSLETANEYLQRKLGYKADNSHFVNAIKFLTKAGFTEKELNVYLLVGLPHQTYNDVKESIIFVKNYHSKPRLAEYSPIPHTILWEESIKVAKFDIVNEPLFHNNTLLPVSHPSINFESLNKLKILARKNY